MIIKPKANLESIQRTALSNSVRVGRIMRLDSNEKTTPLSAEVFQAVMAKIDPEELVAYPYLDQVYNKLAKLNTVDYGNILLFSGSDYGIKSLFEVYVETKDEVVTLTPSYGMYFVYPPMFGAKIIPVGYHDDFSLPVESILNKINTRTKLILIANPNHTGTVIDEVDLCKIIESAAVNKALVLIDEAYHEFYGETGISLIKEYPNLVVSRTMSKAYGIAGLRVGYLVSSTENIRNLAKVRATHEISSVSARFAEYLLDHPEVVRSTVEEVEAGKKYIQERSSVIGIRTFFSRTNFMFMQLSQGTDPKVVIEMLKARNIYLKGPFTEIPVVDMIRVTVGPPEQMSEFMDALQEVLQEIGTEQMCRFD